MNLDIDKWRNGEYDIELKGMAIAFYRSDMAYMAHMEDAKYIPPKKGK